MHKSYLVVARPKTKPLDNGGGEWAFSVEYDQLVYLKDARRCVKEAQRRLPDDEVQIWRETTKTKVIERYPPTKVTE
jgi:hypothetical protein